VGERWQISVTPRRALAKVRVADVAGRQFGRIRADQLRAVDVSEPTLRRWVADGYLHPELPSVYAVGHAARSAESNLAAAVLYAGHGAMLSHGTAAWWWGLINYPPPVIHISTAKRRKSIEGIYVHGRRRTERVDHNGLPVTTVAQTLLDFASCAAPGLLRFALANADYHDLLDIAAVDALRGRGVPGTVKLDEALSIHRPELAQTKSELERRLVGMCEARGFPMPTFNVYRHGWLVDAVWDEQRLIVELDGYRGHRTRAQLESDHRRDLELRAAGWTILRYTWYQLTETPDAVAADLRRYL
jgi:very-short-patch-repair endonuclease